MATYIIRRLLGLIPTLFVITVIGFLMMHAMPGNAFEALVFNPKIKNGAALYHRLLAQNGLDQSLPVQYIHWIGNILQGNFGISYNYQQPVSQLIGTYLPNTLLLAVTAEILILIISIPIGLYQARKVNGPFDVSFSFIAVLLYSIPGFVFALFLLFIFSFSLGWLPSQGTISASGANAGSFLDHLQHLLLPALALALPSLAGYTRLTRGYTLQIIVADFVRTAKAKGLGSKRIMFRHIFRNAIIPLVTQFGFDIGGLFGGAILIEQIFTWPGMGELSLNATLNRDYPLILATTLLFAVMVLIGNLIADILLAASDPRIRLN
nr:ABC transporter permease [Bacilli bacterium]